MFPQAPAYVAAPPPNLPRKRERGAPPMSPYVSSEAAPKRRRPATLTGIVTRRASDHPPSIPRGAIGTEIHVHLHADRERTWLAEVDHHFHHVDVSHIALAE